MQILPLLASSWDIHPNWPWERPYLMYFMPLWHHYDTHLSDGNQTGISVTHLSKMTDLYTTIFATSQMTFTIQAGFTSPIWPWNEIKIFLMLQYILLCCYLNATYTNNCYKTLISSTDSQLRLTNNEKFLKGAGRKYWQKNFAIWILEDVLFILFN